MTTSPTSASTSAKLDTTLPASPRQAPSSTTNPYPSPNPRSGPCRKGCELHLGQAKTDARDAFIIANTARTLPHTLRGITVSEERIAELSMLGGFADDLAAQITQVRNRLHGFLTQIHPALERALEPRLDQRGGEDHRALS